MKIICESQKEYDDLMMASRHLHDFTVWVDDVPKGTKIGITNLFESRDRDGDNETLKLGEGEEGNVVGISVGSEKYPMVGFLQHLYLEGEDFPNKDEVVWVEEK